MSTSPTQRTLARCYKDGWRAQVVEKWIPQINRRVDLFGFGDVLALDGLQGSLLIQATTSSHGANRVTKILEDCTDAATEWLCAGNRIEVWTWAKKGPRGKRKLWTAKRWKVVLRDHDFDFADEDERCRRCGLMHAAWSGEFCDGDGAELEARPIEEEDP